MSIAIKAEHVSKLYRLGVINHGMLYKDIQSYLARKFGKPDPHAKIGKEYREDGPDHYWALKDVSFEIEKGDRVGIIGKNGAGKSTLLKILSRITAPTEGRIKVKGRIASLLEVGTGFHPELTGRENIYLNGAILGMKRAQITKKLDAIIDFSEIEKYIDTPVKRYSSGMYVRLAFAVAAHLDSDILLADEVLAVGDAAFQKKCLGKMEDVSRNQGRTVLFVSHNMAAVSSLCNMGILFDNGRNMNNGEIEYIIQQYLDSSVKSSNTTVSFEQNSNLKAQILKVSISNERGKETNIFSNEDEFACFDLQYIIREKLKMIHVACIIKTKEGYNLFSTSDSDAKPDVLFKEREVGLYRASVKIPIIHWNYDTYYVAFGIGYPGESIDRKEVFHFTKVNLEEKNTMLEKGKRAGILLIRIPWKTEIIEQRKK